MPELRGNSSAKTLRLTIWDPEPLRSFTRDVQPSPFQGTLNLRTAEYELVSTVSVSAENTAPTGRSGEMPQAGTALKSGSSDTSSRAVKPGTDPTLSEKLQANNGVIKRPKNVDPEMTQQPPNIDATMPVIPPSAVRPDTAPDGVKPEAK